jgi:hypothetical protein
MTNHQDDFLREISAMQRMAELRIHERMRAEQLGEAFADLPTRPLLTVLVPSGMDSLIARKAVRR